MSPVTTASNPTTTAVKPQGCTNLKLRQLMRRVAQHYDNEVGKSGLKGTQYSLLSYVVKLGPIRAVDLAAEMKVSTSTLSRNLQPLVAQGWVHIGEGEDGRSRLVTSTEAGRAKRQQGQRAWKQAQLALNASLGLERVARLHVLIAECTAALDAMFKVGQFVAPVDAPPVGAAMAFESATGSLEP